jgi:hypothetical protein
VAHAEQMDYVRSVRDKYHWFFAGTRVLEVGSRYVNGSVRQLFGPCDYTGLDCTPGRCVDVVCLAHEYRSAAPFDVLVSCEAFEHDPHLAKTRRSTLMTHWGLGEGSASALFRGVACGTGGQSGTWRSVTRVLVFLGSQMRGQFPSTNSTVW